MNRLTGSLADERHDFIKRQIQAGGRVLASELAERFGVSEATARRDLRELAEAGLCRKVYGGAVAAAPYDGAFGRRMHVAQDAKANLAAAAVRLLRSGQTVFIDAGTTNAAIARAIPAGLELTVATNAPAVAAILAEQPKLRLIVIGGPFDPETGACTGAEALRQIGQVKADLFLLGACGLDATAGVTAFQPGEADVKRAMVANSTALLVAATNDKLGTAAPFRVAEPGAVTHLIAEAEAPPDALSRFAANGTIVHHATGTGTSGKRQPA